MTETLMVTSFGTRGHAEKLTTKVVVPLNSFGKRATPPKGRGCSPQRTAEILKFSTTPTTVDAELDGVGENVLNRRIEMAKRHIDTHEYPQQKAAALSMMEELEAELKRR